MKIATQLQKQTVAAILRRWPKAMRVFIERGLGCVGCVMAVFDTLEDVARVYHIPLEDLVAEIEAVIDAEQYAERKRRERGDESKVT